MGSPVKPRPRSRSWLTKTLSEPRTRGTSRALPALVLLTPALLLLIVARVFPMSVAVRESFLKGSNRSDGGQWVGLENYVYLLSDPNFWHSVKTTGVFLLIIVPLQVLVALLLGLLLVEKVPGTGWVRTMVFLPVAAPAAVASVIWGIAYQPRGPFNAVLAAVGLPEQPFLTSPHQALMSIIILMSWIGVGYWTIFIIAALEDVPRELYEAAALDGAGWWRCLISITLPSIRRALLFVVVADTVASVLAFVPVQILTRGGPAGSTSLLMYELYITAFGSGDINLGQTMVVLIAIVLSIVTAIQFRMLSKE